MNSVTEPLQPAPVDDLLLFVNERAVEDERLEVRRPEPDQAVLDRCELAALMIQHTRDTDAWARATWRSAVVSMAEVHDDHPDFQRDWYTLSQPNGIVAALP